MVSVSKIQVLLNFPCPLLWVHFNYVFDCKLNYESDASSRKSMDLLKGVSDSEVSFVIKVPFKAANSNATSMSEDGRVLEWDLLSMDADNIHAEFFYRHWQSG